MTTGQTLTYKKLFLLIRMMLHSIATQKTPQVLAVREIVQGRSRLTLAER